MGDDLNREQVSVLRSRLEQRRYEESTLRILHHLLLSSSSSSSSCCRVHLHGSLISLVRSHSLSALLPHSHASLPQQLHTLHFFLRAFYLLHDLQSWLSLSYESLLLRQQSSLPAHPQLVVSSSEWFSFAHLAFSHAFYSVAAQACRHALLSFNVNDVYSQPFSIHTIHTLYNHAILLSSTHSVQAHAAQYETRKNFSRKQSSVSKEKQPPASLSYANGIKLHNARNLMRLKNQ